MHTPSWFHGRIALTVNSIVAPGGDTLIMGQARGRIGVILGYQADNLNGNGTMTQATYTITGNVDPVTGNVAETATPGAGGVSTFSASTPYTIWSNSKNGSANGPLRMILSARDHLELNWFDHGDTVMQQWWARCPVGTGGLLWWTEVNLIKGTVDDYLEWLDKSGRR